MQFSLQLASHLCTRFCSRMYVESETVICRHSEIGKSDFTFGLVCCPARHWTHGPCNSSCDHTGEVLCGGGRPQNGDRWTEGISHTENGLHCSCAGRSSQRSLILTTLSEGLANISFQHRPQHDHDTCSEVRSKEHLDCGNPITSQAFYF